MLKIRPIASSEIPLLKEFAPPDWKSDISAIFAFHFGQLYFHPLVADLDGKVVGCAEGLLNGDTGWLGNIIVLPDFRGRGIGQALTAGLVDFFRSRGCAHQLLVATAMGEPVYTKLGFEACSKYVFLKRKTAAANADPSGVREYAPQDYAALIALDRTASAEERQPFLGRFLPGAWVHSTDGTLDGFYLPALGNGLIVAADTRAGLELLQYRAAVGPENAVVPEANAAALKFLQENGFEETRRAPRMALGGDVDWKPRMVYQRGAGYCG